MEINTKDNGRTVKGMAMVSCLMTLIGLMNFYDNSSYEGDWKDDKMEGFGRFE